MPSHTPKERAIRRQEKKRENVPKKRKVRTSHKSDHKKRKKK